MAHTFKCSQKVKWTKFRLITTFSVLFWIQKTDPNQPWVWREEWKLSSSCFSFSTSFSGWVEANYFTVKHRKKKKNQTVPGTVSTRSKWSLLWPKMKATRVETWKQARFLLRSVICVSKIKQLISLFVLAEIFSMLGCFFFLFFLREITQFLKRNLIF